MGVCPEMGLVTRPRCTRGPPSEPEAVSSDYDLTELGPRSVAATAYAALASYPPAERVRRHADVPLIRCYCNNYNNVEFQIQLNKRAIILAKMK